MLAPTRLHTQTVSVATAAEFMLGQLDRHRLEVSLAPAPDPRHRSHYIRIVENRNPLWYRQLCAEYITRRSRPRRRGSKYIDTLIKRRQVLRALAQISRGGGGVSVYSRRVLPYVEICAQWLADSMRDEREF